jgi:outer membrane protein OmpA-like peptidoglycan-associated protein
MRENGNRLWRGAMGVAPLAILFLGRVAAAEPMEGTPSMGTGASSSEESAAPVCKNSGVTVSFRTGSSEIDKNGQGALAGVATWVQNGDQRTVRLQGYTDKVGNAAANQRLSERRAQAAEDFLLGKGVSADRITVVGHGEETAEAVTGADARVVMVQTCDVPKKMAEAAPPPEAATPPEPATPPEAPAEPVAPPPVAVTPPVAPAPPPAEPMYEPVPAPVAHHAGPPSQLGIEASIGGGATGFIDSAVRNTVNTGGAWDARLTFGTRLPIAIEGAYVGTAQSINALGLTTNANLIGNGVEGDLRLNFTNFKVQPYIFGGAGWTHYQINNSAINTSSVASSDNIGTVPLGAGISIRPSQVFIIDIRGTYRATFDEQMFDRVTNSTNSMQNWNAYGRVGFEF